VSAANANGNILEIVSPPGTSTKWLSEFNARALRGRPTQSQHDAVIASPYLDGRAFEEFPDSVQLPAGLDWASIAPPAAMLFGSEQSPEQQGIAQLSHGSVASLASAAGGPTESASDALAQIAKRVKSSSRADRGVVDAMVRRRLVREVAMSVQAAPGIFGAVSRIVSLVPRYIVVNRSDMQLVYRQYLPDNRSLPAADVSTLVARRLEATISQQFGRAARHLLHQQLSAGVHRRNAIRVALDKFDDALKLAFGPEAKVSAFCRLEGADDEDFIGNPMLLQSESALRRESSAHARSANRMLVSLGVPTEEYLPPYAPLTWSEAAVSHEQDRDGDGQIDRLLQIAVESGEPTAGPSVFAAIAATAAPLGWELLERRAEEELHAKAHLDGPDDDVSALGASGRHEMPTGNSKSPTSFLGQGTSVGSEPAPS